MQDVFLNLGFGLACASVAILLLLTLWLYRSRKPLAKRGSFHQELDALFADTKRALRVLSLSARQGGVALMHENQEEVGRLLIEIQGRLRMLDDGVRRKYEPKAIGILTQAAKAGITLPPP